MSLFGLETCVQIKYEKAPYSNLLTIDKGHIIQKIDDLVKVN